MDSLLSKEDMEAVLDILDEGIQVVNLEGIIVYCNEAAAELDSLKKEEVVGKHILEIYPSLTKETSTLIESLKTGKAIYHYQQDFLNYKGSKITTVNSTIPLHKNGQLVGALELSRNITQVRELSERLVDLQEKIYAQKPSVSKAVKGTARYTFDDIIGESPEIIKLKHQSMKAAATHSSVIVYGNTGTGKELIVQAIHNASERRKKPFIAQNCAAIPVALLESILFGTVKGSFTGADHRPGLFELANEGTLFLDEINSMPMELQAKLLRVLEEKSIRRVGDIKTREVNVRIIAAMNMDPFQAVHEKKLREDLFYRLNVVSLRLPDLMEREKDFSVLLTHFINRFNCKLNKNIVGVTPEALRKLKNHSWPGNVRELENIIEGMMNVMEGQWIKMEDLPYYLQRGKREEKDLGAKMVLGAHTSLRELMNSVEKQVIASVFKDEKGNITKTAERLSVPRQTLQYRLSKLGIELEKEK
ncbi:sigma-54 interaction domain-containing protein [Tindallia californiensis]|uniref:Arginine utilization regulatory protein n=1 Tax=Tindallia californiensis TaxID=159292 RepID=A0A1H3L221_9FIRM|nr:sigma 54-interacting transcriptional regulator [Tindallia californiensis]SDY58463.1 arginine utilization regulatory protein [Tindallia californiensis]